VSQDLMKQIDALVALEVRSAVMACEGNPIGAAMIECDAKGERRLLQLGLRTLAAERDQWKANHDAQVERARLLHERPDLPIERVKAYEQVGRMRSALKSIASLKVAALVMIGDQSIPETAITTAGLKDAVRIANNALKE
jgi:hypothetical protein